MMMKNVFRLLAFILMLNLTNSFAKTYEVLTLNKRGERSMVFEPTYLKVEVGDTVRFVPKNKGHTSQSVFIPDGANSWNGKTSREISITLKQEGIYIYECKNHGIMGMTGIIQAGKAVNLIKAKDFLKKYKDKFIMNKDKLEMIFNRVYK